METPSLKLSLGLLLLGATATLAGALMCEDVAGAPAAQRYAIGGGAFVAALFLSQCWVCLRRSGRLVEHILYRATAGLGLAYFLLSMGLPSIFDPDLSVLLVRATLVASLWLLGLNLLSGVRKFDAEWQRVGQAAFEQVRPRGSAVLDWSAVLAPMRLELGVYLPGLAAWRADALATMLALVSLPAGLLIWEYHVAGFAIAALGFTLLLASIAQMIGMHFGQAARIRALERKLGKQLLQSDQPYRPKRKRLKRRA